jgi:hypothetical protein
MIWWVKIVAGEVITYQFFLSSLPGLGVVLGRVVQRDLAFDGGLTHLSLIL